LTSIVLIPGGTYLLSEVIMNNVRSIRDYRLKKGLPVPELSESVSDPAIEMAFKLVEQLQDSASVFDILLALNLASLAVIRGFEREHGSPAVAELMEEVRKKVVYYDVVLK
jgi:hypothetical protein